MALLEYLWATQQSESVKEAVPCRGTGGFFAGFARPTNKPRRSVKATQFLGLLNGSGVPGVVK